LFVKRKLKIFNEFFLMAGDPVEKGREITTGLKTFHGRPGVEKKGGRTYGKEKNGM
jgi:hypothetical protein